MCGLHKRARILCTFVFSYIVYHIMATSALSCVCSLNFVHASLEFSLLKLYRFKDYTISHKNIC